MPPLLCLFALALVLGIKLALKFLLLLFLAIEPSSSALPWLGAITRELNNLETVRKGSSHGGLRSPRILPSARFSMEEDSSRIGPLVKIWWGAVHWFRNVPRASRHAQQGMRGLPSLSCLASEGKRSPPGRSVQSSGQDHLTKRSKARRCLKLPQCRSRHSGAPKAERSRQKA